MKKKDWDDQYGLVVLVHCKCSVWPVFAASRVGRCGECGVRPSPIPDWEEER